MVLYHGIGRQARTLAFAIAAGVTICALEAQAQTPIREAVTVTAAAEPLTFDAQSRVVYVVTREQLARLPVRSVADALALLAPVDVRTRGVDGMQADFSIRGAAFGQTLVLLDGVRLNDAQSGHHNSDIPVTLDDIERIEVLAGAGSSLHGADALGGTINVVTRRERRGARFAVGGASFGSADVEGHVDHAALGLSGAFARSDGFEYDRDYRTATLNGRVALGAHKLTVAWLDRAFGADGFYGASPSKEWTSQLLVGVNRSRLRAGDWQVNWRAAARAHRDRFLWDVRRPGVLENRHRSYATTAAAQAERALKPSLRLAIGGEAGGDWVESSNLGDHGYGRGSGSAEMRYQRGRVFATPALRFDAYSRFGQALSPSLSAGYWVGPVKLRGSTGRAFRVPTFTELYYRDPNHIASDTLRPEDSWSLEGGADWLAGSQWLAGATTFVRFEDDVIDWVRATAAERWHTANIRDVTTKGLELSVTHLLRSGGQAQLQYVLLDSSAPSLDLLSKYVLDYAKHRATASAVGEVGAKFSLGASASFTHRADGRDYLLVDARVSRQFGSFSLMADVRNLLDEDYQEVVGVDMPGRSGRIALTWAAR